jgi:hypothetical protein
MRAIILGILGLCAALGAFAQKPAFIYIQGDKKTPFYVKIDDKMQPRYGKNYSIIPELLPGVVNIELLFQQNVFPAQKFAIHVPEGGERGFLVIEKSGEISLYDLEQGFYLPAGNSPDEDRAPVRAEVPAAIAVRTTPDRTPVATIPTETPKPRPATRTEDPGPRFIPDVVLGGEGTGARTSAAASATSCGEAMDVKEFAALYRKALDVDEQDNRLVFLNKQTSGCFSPTQIRLLTRVLERDAARFTFLKKIQPRLTNAARFAELEDLLSAEVYRARFRELLQPR